MCSSAQYKSEQSSACCKILNNSVFKHMSGGAYLRAHHTNQIERERDERERELDKEKRETDQNREPGVQKRGLEIENDKQTERKRRFEMCGGGREKSWRSKTI